MKRKYISKKTRKNRRKLLSKKRSKKGGTHPYKVEFKDDTNIGEYIKNFEGTIKLIINEVNAKKIAEGSLQSLFYSSTNKEIDDSLEILKSRSCEMIQKLTNDIKDIYESSYTPPEVTINKVIPTKCKSEQSEESTEYDIAKEFNKIDKLYKLSNLYKKLDKYKSDKFFNAGSWWWKRLDTLYNSVTARSSSYGKIIQDKLKERIGFSPVVSDPALTQPQSPVKHTGVRAAPQRFPAVPNREIQRVNPQQLKEIRDSTYADNVRRSNIRRELDLSHDEDLHDENGEMVSF